MTKHHQRIGRFIAAGLALAIVTGAGATKAVASGGSDDSFRVTFTETSPLSAANFGQAFQGDSSRCGTFTPADLPCVVPVTPAAGFDSTFTGGLKGTSKSESGAVIAVTVSIDPATFSEPYVSMGKVTGSVAGCGAGTFILQGEGNLNSPLSTWKVVTGTGTGALAHLSGHGTRNAVFNPTVTTTYTGRMSCHGED
jgi:Protein of unknown function (DUF3224)